MTALFILGVLLLVAGCVAFLRDWLDGLVSELILACSMLLFSTDRFAARDPYLGWLFAVITVTHLLMAVRINVLLIRKAGAE